MHQRHVRQIVGGMQIELEALGIAGFRQQAPGLLGIMRIGHAVAVGAADSGSDDIAARIGLALAYVAQELPVDRQRHRQPNSRIEQQISCSGLPSKRRGVSGD